MKRCSIWLVVLSFWALSAYANSFAVLAGSTVTNTGTTVVTGDLGVSPGSAITGFPPGIVDGTTDDGNAAAMAGQVDLAGEYGALAGMAVDQTLTGEDLGGLTLLPGVYSFSSSAQLRNAHSQRRGPFQSDLRFPNREHAHDRERLVRSSY
jgi:hypothetical protein